MAPEVLNDKGYDGRAADIWSCGVILYVLLAGFLPFDEPHMSQLFRKIQKADFTYPSWFTAPVRGLLDRILVADPTKRLGIKEIEEDAWFLGPDNYHDDNYAGDEAVAATAAMAAAAAAAAGGAGAGAGAGAGGRSLPHVPSEKDVDEAVADIGDGLDETPGEAPAAAPPALNAFEVSGRAGGEPRARAHARPHFVTGPPPPSPAARKHVWRHGPEQAHGRG